MRRQIRGLTQGVKNTKEGISLCQVADGALAEVNAMLHRITELSVQAVNGTNAQEDRDAIQQEIQQLVAEINRIGDTTTYNDQPIFRGADELILDATGNSVSFGELPFTDFAITDVNLGGPAQS